MTAKQVLLKIWQGIKVLIQHTNRMRIALRRYWQQRASQDMGDPLHYPRLLRYRWRQAVKYVYLVLGALALLLAGIFAVHNRFESAWLWHYRYFSTAPGSPVLCGSFLLIAAFLIARFRHLATQEPPEDNI